MISLNGTILVEMVLFLFFLWIVNRTVFRPLLRTMDGRATHLDTLKTSAEQARIDAEQLRSDYIERLTEANQTAAHRLRDARLSTYRENRICLDDLRGQAEADMLAHRARLAELLETERAEFKTLIPVLVEEMDRQVRSEGHLL